MYGSGQYITQTAVMHAPHLVQCTLWSVAQLPPRVFGCNTSGGLLAGAGKTKKRGSSDAYHGNKATKTPRCSMHASPATAHAPDQEPIAAAAANSRGLTMGVSAEADEDNDAMTEEERQRLIKRLRTRYGAVHPVSA